jgi:hypothetical protein
LVFWGNGSKKGNTRKYTEKWVTSCRKMFWRNIGLSTLIYEENGSEGEFGFGYFEVLFRDLRGLVEEGGH